MKQSKNPCFLYLNTVKGYRSQTRVEGGGGAGETRKQKPLKNVQKTINEVK